MEEKEEELKGQKEEENSMFDSTEKNQVTVMEVVTKQQH